MNNNGPPSVWLSVFLDLFRALSTSGVSSYKVWMHGYELLSLPSPVPSRLSVKNVGRMRKYPFSSHFLGLPFQFPLRSTHDDSVVLWQKEANLENYISRKLAKCVSRYSDINAITFCLDLNIFQQDECFCSKLGMEVEHAKSNINTSFSLI